MDTVFSNTSADHPSAGSWSIDIIQAWLRAVLYKALDHARQRNRTVLTSIVFPVEFQQDSLAVLRVFQQQQIGECFFWEQPSQQKVLVGVGIASTIEVHGSERFKTATSAWKSIQQDAYVERVALFDESVGGPIFFGGFAFDALAPHTPLWQGFPDGLLMLPSVLYHARGSLASLTLNTLLSIDADIEQLTTALSATILRVHSALEAAAQSQDPLTSSIPQPLHMHELVSREAWQQIVADAVAEIQQGSYQKVVLARAVQVTREAGTFDILESLARLRTNYPNAYVFVVQRGGRYFMGATPERLVYGQEGQLRTMALAGSTPRGATPEEDCRLGTELLNSAKNKNEHEIVVSMIRSSLSQFCSKVWIADAPHLLQLKNIQHLETPIVGELLPGHCVLEALEGLHPTPAVGGYPSTQTALETIRRVEHLDRGWYAGPVGWINRSGNGEFAVALRSGLVDPASATLFAGCGIVADSQPESEYAESCVKLQVMLRGLGGEE
jgi:isochorismate synthase